VCHSDLHQVRSEWAGTVYPCVPGHEIVGRVSAVGAQVSGFRVGDLVGVGCIVDSCQHCDSCQDGLENYCDGMVGTYNFPTPDAPGHTLGGYSERIVVHQRYVLRVRHPEEQLAAVAPLLCAGITTYSPLKHWKVGPGQKVGVVGLGGLGHMGIKFARAMGAHVVMVTTSPEKGKDALRLGAHEVLVSTDPDAMAKAASSFHFLLNTIPVGHDTNPYLGLLRLDGTMVLVGALTPLTPVVGANLIMSRRSVAGSAIGGMAETQEMIDFCAEHGITSDVEMIAIQDINTAYERMLKNDVRYRFVIDMASLKQAA
jgi:uncharacterized zinc-type alcohol dehydrogenase-like protein